MKKAIYKNGKHLRYGYTTGSCAAAAAKAATRMLETHKRCDAVKLMTPKGWELNLSVVDIEMDENFVKCAIIKDSGDDPDITNGIKIFAKVRYADETTLVGGVGIGMVTRKGISVPVGMHAINPVPREMILTSVKEETKQHVHIEISAPEGVEIGKKTFNPKLGIEGGISIIGTTGIVEPMSEEAFKESLNIELKLIEDEAMVFAPGNYGRDYCVKHDISESKIIKTSNFVGYMFDRAVEQKKKKILFVGHIGKLIKVAGGIYHTHSRVSDARMDILVSHMVKADIELRHLKYVLDCNTTEEAVNYLVDNNLNRVFQLIVNSIKERLEGYTYDALEVEVVMFSLDQGWLSETVGVKALMEVLSE